LGDTFLLNEGDFKGSDFLLFYVLRNSICWHIARSQPGLSTETSSGNGWQYLWSSLQWNVIQLYRLCT